MALRLPALRQPARRLAIVLLSDDYAKKRVAVLDMNTGAIKRCWGAYGNRPEDVNLGPYNPDAPLAQQFRNPVHYEEPRRPLAGAALSRVRGAPAPHHRSPSLVLAGGQRRRRGRDSTGSGG